MNINKSRIGLAVFLLHLILLLPVWPQEYRSKAVAVIIYHEGEDFEIRDNRGSPVNIDEIIGHRLYEGDIILAGENTFLEIQLILSQNVIKIAENTDFQLQWAEEKQENAFSMLYGSVRARLKKLKAGQYFYIQGGDAIAGVRGTDFGMNVQVPFGKEQGREKRVAVPVTEIYCFEGTVEVKPQFKIEGEKPVEPIIINQDEMITLSAEEPERFEKRPVSEEIRAYWLEHPFIGELIPPDEVASLGMERKIPLIWKLERKQKRSTLTGSAFLSLGLIFEISGAVSLATGFRESDSTKSAVLKKTGYALIASGALFLTYSVFKFIRAGRIGREIEQLP